MSKAIELLAPAKDVTCGMAAVDHGADAVYIGAERFGARQRASNSIEDIRRLCQYAHRYMAKVYVTLNTLVFDDETDAVSHLLRSLLQAGVDAFIVQDMALAYINKAGVTPTDDPSAGDKGQIKMLLHASTQTDNRSIAKARWLHSVGFKRVVLARELSLGEISAIHSAVPGLELEAFVHGALCVSYSGQCYASQFCFQRSANRGECAQLCRMKFTLTDAAGRSLTRPMHLLSLKDMCRYDYLEAMMDAGISSFKIEGRLKDISYVKNVTAAYSQRLNEIISHSNGRWRRASIGTCSYTFHPDVRKSFNRRFTDYFLLDGIDERKGGNYDVTSFYTPKAVGEYVGTVTDIRPCIPNDKQPSAPRHHHDTGFITVRGTAAFANGDGLCFLDHNHQLVGFRVNRAENRGTATAQQSRLYPYIMPAQLRKGMPLYRNYDHKFEQSMAGKSADRRIPVAITLSETADGYRLTMNAAGNIRLSATASIHADKQQAHTPQAENIKAQLCKLGNTVYKCDDITIMTTHANPFIPSSKLAEMRRALAANMDKAIAKCLSDSHEEALQSVQAGAESDARQPMPYPADDADKLANYPYLLNVSNSLARQFYAVHGLNVEKSAFEIAAPREPLLMQCRLCLRYAMGFCQRYGGKRPQWQEPLSLLMGGGKRFTLEFDCKNCQMNVYSEDANS